MSDENLPSSKPYLIRALYEWCVDHGYTPYISVVVDGRTRVPREFVRDGQIVLNVGPEATGRLQMGNELITFGARFNGAAQEISVPVSNVAAIYARENGHGMGFEVELDDTPLHAADDGARPAPASLSAVEGAGTAPSRGDGDDDGDGPKGGRPRLQRIK